MFNLKKFVIIGLLATSNTNWCMIFLKPSPINTTKQAGLTSPLNCDQSALNQAILKILERRLPLIHYFGQPAATLAQYSKFTQSLLQKPTSKL